jgi:protein-L-isoaspartate O-methyltransferase
MAEMLDALDLEAGQRVLEIGAGTGYNAALLAHVVGPEGRITSVELESETAREARRALSGTGVKVVTGDGREGHAPGALYDRIIATASADEIPRAWLDQLAPGGLLQVPLRLRTSAGLQLIPTLRRDGQVLRSVDVICGGFMPLRARPDDLSSYWPMLNVVRTSGGESAMLFVLSGDGLQTLSSAAARRLVATACSDPEVRPLRMRARAKSLAVHLMLRGPVPRLVAAWDGREFLGGLIARDGKSMALVPGWPTATRMLVYGKRDAAGELLTLIRDWDRAGRPSESDVELAVHFRNGSSAIRTRRRGR